MLHRDSTGVVQRIEPGAINWMTAGRGIVHSERTPDDLRGRTRTQPRPAAVGGAAGATTRRSSRPSRTRRPSAIPVLEARRRHGCACSSARPSAAARRWRRARRRSTWTSRCAPAPRCSCRWPTSARCTRSTRRSRWTGSRCRRGRWWCCTPGEQPLLGAPGDARVVLIGGQPLGRRFMVWNFVSSRKERIVQAQDDWRAQRFDPVPGETDVHPAAVARSEGQAGAAGLAHGQLMLDAADDDGIHAEGDGAVDARVRAVGGQRIDDLEALRRR